MTVSTVHFEEEAGQRSFSSLPLRVTIAIILLHACVALALLPIASQPGPKMPGLLTLCATGIFLAEMATAWLLSVLFREERSWPLLLLFCVYIYSSLMAVSQLLTFPGAILDDQPLLVANDQIAGWIYVAWIYGFGILTFLPVVLEVRFPGLRVKTENAGRALVISLLSVLAFTFFVVAGIVAAADALPAIFNPQRFALIGVRAGAVTLFCITIAIIFLKMRDRNYLYLWLSLALTGLIFQNVMSGFGGGRYSLGWSIGRVSWLLSATALFVFFLHLFSRQHRLLTRARDLLEHVGHGRAITSQGAVTAGKPSIDESIERFVARENIGRYQVMLRAPLEPNQRHAISNLLSEEESRLRRLSEGPHKVAISLGRIDHLF